MPALHIRDVPETTIAALKERAARHGRSMQQELRLLLLEAAEQPLPASEVPPLDLTLAHSGGSSTWSREEIYGDDGR